MAAGPQIRWDDEPPLKQQMMPQVKWDDESSAQPSAGSRFWAGVKHGTGDNSDTPPSHGTWSNPDFADNPMLPGSGVYRDIKAGNYAGATGRVVGPAAELALMFAGGGGKAEPVPPEGIPNLPQPSALGARVRAVGKLAAQDAASHVPYVGRLTRRPSLMDYVKAAQTPAPPRPVYPGAP